MPKKSTITLEQCQKLAESRGGKCLSTEYKNTKTQMNWICKRNHSWPTTFQLVKNHWCKLCSIEDMKLGIESMQKIAAKYNGKCLSETYVNQNTSLMWQCEKGHVFPCLPKTVDTSWCRVCFGQRHDIETAREIGKQYGFVLLSTEYINSNTKLEWKCVIGHIFTMILANIKKHNCPDCSKISGLSERICRVIFENIFKINFKKIRPGWCLNEQGNKLELDGFGEDEKIAFEYQGRQHYEYCEWYHRSIENFEKTQLHDKIKKRLCEEKGIKLVIIPYTIKNDKLFDFILEECKRMKIKIPKNIVKLPISELLLVTKRDDGMLTVLNDIAIKKGGKLLSKAYLGCDVKLQFECHRGHIFPATPAYIKAKGNHWCGECYNMDRSKIFKKAHAKKKLEKQKLKLDQETKVEIEELISIIKKERKKLRKFMKREKVRKIIEELHELIRIEDDKNFPALPFVQLIN